MTNVEIASGGGGRSLLGRRPESPSIDNRNTPHIEGEIPVPNLPNILPLDGVPFGKSTSSSSSSSPCDAEETGYRPPEKPHEPNIVWYYGEPLFSSHSLSPKVLDEYWRNFKDNYSWNPSRADIARRDFEVLSAGLLEEMASIERRFRVEKIIQRYSGVRAYQLHLNLLLKINSRPVGYFVERTKGGVKTDCRKLYHLNRLMEMPGMGKASGRAIYFLGRRCVPPSIDSNGISHIEGQSPVPNSPRMLPVPPRSSRPSSSSFSPCAMEETGDTPEQKPMEQDIVCYYGQPHFSWSSLSQDRRDSCFRHYSAQLRLDPSIAYLLRGEYEKMCEKNAAEIADMERRLQMERKMIQRISRSRVLQLHVKFLRKMGLFKKRMYGGIGYAGDFQRSISIAKRNIYSGRGLKSPKHRSKVSVGERSAGGRLILTEQKGKRPTESSSVSFRASEARRAEQR